MYRLFRRTGEKQTQNKAASDIRKHIIKTPDAGGGTQLQQSNVIDKSDDEMPKTDNKEANLDNYKEYLRELDVDIWIMLSLPLTLNPEPENVEIVHYFVY